MMKKTAVAALLILTLAGCGDVKGSDEYKSLSSDLASAKAQVKDLQAEADRADSAYAALQGDLPTREQAVKDAQAKIQKATAALKQWEADVKRREKDVAARERKVGIVEKQVAANTIPGDGVYRVGQDMKPGTYRSEGNTDCYWMISGDANGSNIIENDIVTGPSLVTVSSGTFFTSNRCGDWVLQR